VLLRTMRLPVALAVAFLLFSTTPFLRALPVEVLAGAVTYARLGPADGWRCLNQATYRYDPGIGMQDRRLVAERPEAMAAAAFGNDSFISEHVEVMLGADRGVIHGRLLSGSGRVTSRVVALQAMVAQPVSVDLPWQSVSTCDVGLRAWRVVAI
jgi:hypothetical protein